MSSNAQKWAEWERQQQSNAKAKSSSTTTMLILVAACAACAGAYFFLRKPETPEPDYSGTISLCGAHVPTPLFVAISVVASLCLGGGIYLCACQTTDTTPAPQELRDAKQLDVNGLSVEYDNPDCGCVQQGQGSPAAQTGGDGKPYNAGDTVGLKWNTVASTIVGASGQPYNNDAFQLVCFAEPKEGGTCNLKKGWVVRAAPSIPGGTAPEAYGIEATDVVGNPIPFVNFTQSACTGTALASQPAVTMMPWALQDGGSPYNQTVSWTIKSGTAGSYAAEATYDGKTMCVTGVTEYMTQSGTIQTSA